MKSIRLASLLLVPLFAACSSGGDDAASGPPSTTPDAGNNSDGSSPVADAGPLDASTELALPTGKFRVGSWCGLPGNQVTQARMDEFAAAGFTSLSSGCEGPYAADYNAKTIEYAGKSGVGVMLADARVSNALAGTDVDANLKSVVDEFGSAPGLESYIVVDEPPASQFPSIATVRSKLAALDTVHPAYTNLLPNYATGAQLGAASYGAYVGQYLTTVKPMFASWDYYPFLSDGSIMGGFFQNMEDFRNNALATKTPFFQYIQSTAFTGHRLTTENEKLWVGTMSLAYGAAGVAWFTYWTLPSRYGGIGSALIDEAGNETAEYGQAKRINAKLAAWGKYIAVAQSTSVFHGAGLYPGVQPRPAFAHAYVPKEAPFVIGTFTVNGGADEYVFFSNRDIVNPIESDVYVANGSRAPEMLDLTSGTFVPMTVLGTDANGTKIHVKLDGADGALVHLHGPIGDGAPGAEAYVMTVRADAGSYAAVDSAFGAATIGTHGWSDTCPTGYVDGGKYFTSNGFGLCVRKDLITRTFYVGNVVSNTATLFSAANGAATAVGQEAWDTCPNGSKELGRKFDVNGFWICLK
ncbi:MAG TPA: hypothetical protein VF407_05310 [Polyangiaceae bacterium]